jgi:heme-degrading monooxygenase HmoA/uncharacterized protein YciI
MHYLLFYEVGDDYVSRRAAHRNEHLGKAWQASERGELVLGGALANPTDCAVLLFKGTSPEVAERFARADPYVTSGIVKRWYVREWSTVAGDDASTPVRPDADKRDEPKDLILRMWRARASAEGVDGYIRHATQTVFPSLEAIEGHRGAYLLRRTVGGVIELVVLTLWESMEAIRKFAGAEPAKAVVEPEARATLMDLDSFVTHFDVVHSTVEGRVK